MSSQSKTFDFVKLSELPQKPRKTGVIEFRGPYYTPVTYGYLSDLLEDWGDYVDGFKFAGGSMRLLDRDKTKMRTFGDVVKETTAHLDAGAKILMLESEGITEDLPSSKWRKDVVKKLVDKFGYHTWMFEASDPPVFKWYLKTFGKDVNLFIDHSQIVEFNAWRLGLWGDPGIWKGKRLSYPSMR